MSRKYKQGTYTPINKGKFIGKTNPVYRSGWENMFMKWCDYNPDVISWCSEQICIPYYCESEAKIRRYYIDFCLKFKSGNTMLIEIKPKRETIPPVPSKGKRKDILLEEALTFEKNQAKWKAASDFAKNNGCVFAVFTEDMLKALGLPIGK